MPDLPLIDVADLPADLPPDLTVLDVREPEEWAAGHVEDSLHLPLGEVTARFTEIPSNAKVLVVCKVGGRSAQATMWLAQQGLDVVNLDGGLLAWERAGRPLVTDAGTPGFVG